MIIDIEALGQLLFTTLLTPLLVSAGLLLALIAALAFVNMIRPAGDEQI